MSDPVRAVRTDGPTIRDDWLTGVNESFGSWGGAEMYDWVFGRDVGGPSADVMVLDGPEGPLAGSGVSYRRVRLHGGTPILVGIMTGSWTLPHARGRGCFSRIIQESMVLARRRGAALLLAFVTQDNASARRLVEAGAAQFPTWYCFSEPTTPQPPGATAPARPVTHGEIRTWLHGRSQMVESGASAFTYPSAEAWAGQYLDRPSDADILEIAGGWAIRERAAASDRINLLVDGDEPLDRPAAMAALLADALARDRQLFTFTTDEDLAATCRRLSMVTKPGFLAVLVVDDARLREGPDPGDPEGTTTSRARADTREGSAFGPWRIHGGDRV